MKITLRELREQSKKTVAEVATALNRSRQAVEHYEKGLRTIGVEDIPILKELYDCTADEIIEAQINSRKNRLDNQ